MTQKDVAKILVTGANGYIGRNFLDFLLARGINVVALVRKPKDFPVSGVEVHPYDLSVPPDIEWFAGVDAVVHLAAVPSGSPETEELEYQACKNLLNCASDVGISKFLFVSSQSASPVAGGQYGKTKWRIEQLVGDVGGRIARPGLVYGGGHEGALFAMLSSFVNKFPALPAFYPSPDVQPIHVDDLCTGFLEILISETARPAPYCLADSQGVGFSNFLKLLAWHRYRRVPLMIFFPTVVLYFFARVINLLPLPNLIDSERIDGLLSLKPMDSELSLQDLNLELRPISAGFKNRKRSRREMIDEGRAMIEYVSGRRASAGVVKRYVAVVEKLYKGTALGLPFLVVKYPFLMRVFDPRWPLFPLTNEDKCEINWRMDAANIIAESSPDYVASYSCFEEKTISRVFFSVCYSGVKELPLMLFSIVVKCLSACGLISPVTFKNASKV